MALKNLAIDSRGGPLAVCVEPANQHDSQTLIEILRLIRKINISKFAIVATDSAYNSNQLRKYAAKYGFVLHASTNKHRNKHLKKLRGCARHTSSQCKLCSNGGTVP